MSRKALDRDERHTTAIELGYCKNSDEINLIKASNSELLLAPGYSLAIIDENGKIVRQGPGVRTEVFDAMSAQVIKRFCEKFRGFTEADFKKSA